MPYDVVLFGDVDPRREWLSPSQMNMLLDFVGNEGGGFGLVAGESFAPGRFVDTPLERLIPVRVSPSSAHTPLGVSSGNQPTKWARMCLTGIHGGWDNEASTRVLAEKNTVLLISIRGGLTEEGLVQT